MSSSRGSRKDRSTAFNGSSSEETQLWQQVRSQIKVLEKAHSNFVHDQEESEKRKAALPPSAGADEAGGSGSGSGGVDERQALASILLKLKQSTNEELQATDGAIESLGILTALRSHNDDYGKRDLPAAMIRDFQLTSSPLTTPAGDTKRKKRRGDTSPSPFTGAGGRASSPISSRSHDAPAVAAAAGRDSYEGTPSRRAAAASGAATPSATGRPGMSSRRGTVSSRDGPGKDGGTAAAADPARARKEALASQLPLAKGRKVAFHQPSKVAGKADSTPLPDDSDDWILALVVECTNQTTHRYIVQDVEGDDPTSTPPTFHTTLKSIVPLPESASTLPEKDYAVGTEVMALYPDTSCFYKAVVKGGGPGLGVLSRKQREKRGNDLLEAKYQLEFEDDGGDIKSVAAYLVVERP